MANQCRNVKMTKPFDVEVRICTDENNSDVSVSMNVIPPSSFLSDWTMSLQRYDGGWKTVGTRTGYLEYASPSNRTFTNVGITNKPMRVSVRFHEGETITSKQWVR